VVTTLSRLMQFLCRSAADGRIGSMLSGKQVVAYLAIAAIGLFLAALGSALMLDLLSFRAVLASLGAWRLLRLAVRAHVALQHSGAQVIETLAGGAGLAMLVWLAWWLHQVRPVPRIRHAEDSEDRGLSSP
jgi:hypothetical protein